MPLRGYKDLVTPSYSTVPGQLAYIHCIFPGHSLLYCLPRHFTYTITDKNPVEVELVFKD